MMYAVMMYTGNRYIITHISIYIQYTVWDELPYIIFTVASVIGMLFALLLPESLGRPLPDSIASKYITITN